MTDQGVLIRISTDGKLLEYGNELQSIRSIIIMIPSSSPILEEWIITDRNQTQLSGQVKPLALCDHYYSHYDESTKAGKLKSIGTLILDLLFQL